MRAYYRINDPRVAHETIDGETIVIDFDSGSYYGIDGIGVAVWDLIARGVSVQDIAESAARRYAEYDVAGAIARFVEALSAEGLVVPASGPAEASALDAVSFPEVFQTPSLQKYTDMQDLLLLDPIHDVSDGGWPERKTS